MAVVYRARDTYLGRPVSIKILREQFAMDADFIQRFRREAQAVASLSHPNIVSLYDVGQDGDLHFLVMEYVEGENLKDHIARNGPLEPREAVDVTLQVLDALEHAHQRQVVHRDIKSHNILLASNGRVKVTDFGIARAAALGTLVHTDKVIGSAHYFSPEQARGRMVDERSDLYSLGVVLYEMLTGDVPFHGDNPISVGLKHVQEEPLAPRQANPAIPPDIEKVIKKALAKDPAQRYQAVAEFRADLQNWLAGRPVRAGDDWGSKTLVAGMEPVTAADQAAARPPNGRAARRPPRGNLKPWAIGLAVLLVLAGAAGYLFLRWFQVPAVEVPDVRRLSQVKAAKVLEDRGLRAVPVAEQNNDEVPTGYVIDQSPAPGEMVKRGREIGLVLSLGPQLITVRDVTGLHRQVAQNLLTNEGFRVEAVSRYDENVPKDYVINQNPSGGSPVKRGTAVYLTISQGPPPPPFSMPDLRGSTREDALNTLQQMGLRLRQETRALSGYPEGRVVRQVPAPNETVREGDQVDLVVSEGCAAVTTRTFPVQAVGPVTVRVTVTDQLGERVIYERSHQPGDQVSLPDICWDATVGRLTVYVDGQAVSQEMLTP